MHSIAYPFLGSAHRVVAIPQRFPSYQCLYDSALIYSTQRCVLHFRALASLFISFHFLSIATPFLRLAARFLSSANRFLSKLCHFLSTHIEAFSLLLDSAHSFASALLICADPLPIRVQLGYAQAVPF